MGSALSFTTFSPVSLENNLNDQKFFSSQNTMKVTPDSPNNEENVSNIINLPSGKQAIQSRPSLAGLKKFSEIEQLRNEMNGSTENETTNEDTKRKEMEKANINYMKWSVGLIILGAVG